METQSALARRTDPSTSHSAASNVSLNTLQQHVLDAFTELGEMTDKTLNELFDGEGYSESTVRKRRSELTKMGKIVDTGRRDGRHAIWKLA